MGFGLEGGCTVIIHIEAKETSLPAMVDGERVLTFIWK